MARADAGIVGRRPPILLAAGVGLLHLRDLCVQRRKLVTGQKLGVALGRAVLALDVLLDVTDRSPVQVAIQNDLPHIAERLGRQALDVGHVLGDPSLDGLLVQLARVVVVQNVNAQRVLDGAFPLSYRGVLRHLGDLLDLSVEAELRDALFQSCRHFLKHLTDAGVEVAAVIQSGVSTPFPLVLVHHGGQFLLQFLVQQPHIGAGDAPVLTLCRLRVLRGGLRRKGSIPPKLGAYSLFNHLLVLVVGQRQSPLYGHLRRFGDGLRA